MEKVFEIQDMVSYIASYLTGSDVISFIETCKTLYKYRVIRDAAIKKFTLVEALKYENMPALVPYLRDNKLIKKFRKNYVITSTTFYVRVLHKLKELYPDKNISVLYSCENKNIHDEITECCEEISSHGRKLYISEKYTQFLAELYPEHSKMFTVYVSLNNNDFASVRIFLKDTPMFLDFANKFPVNAMHVLYYIVDNIPTLSSANNDFIEKYTNYICNKNYSDAIEKLCVFSDNEYFWEYLWNLDQNACLKLAGSPDRIPYNFLKKYIPELVFSKVFFKFSNLEIMQIAQDLYSGDLKITNMNDAYETLTKLSINRGWPALCINLINNNDINIDECDIAEGNAINFVCDYRAGGKDPESLIKYLTYLHSKDIGEYKMTVRRYIQHRYSDTVIKMHMIWNNITTIPYPREWKNFSAYYIKSDEVFTYALRNNLLDLDSCEYLEPSKAWIYLDYKK